MSVEDPDAALLEDIDLPSLQELDSSTGALSQLLIGIRRHLHMRPELGFREFGTREFIRSVLEHYGLSVRGPVAETGSYVDIGGDSSTERVAYRADIDALPIEDAKDVPYRSRTPGVAHLCGHDAHTAVGMGVALLLKAGVDQSDGAYRVFFQPNEESMPSGAPAMIRDGILDGVKSVYGIHVDPTLPSGTYGVIAGPATAAADRFDITIRYPSTGHSARPHETGDTMWVATQVAQALYQLAGRITDARNPTVITICRFKGGDVHNVIPDEVSFGGTLRTTSPDERGFLQDKMRDTAHRTAELYGARATVEIEKGAPAVLNDIRLVNAFQRAVAEVDGTAAVERLPRASMGAEDFAHYTQKIPGALIRAGTRSGPATSHPLHDHKFDIDEAVLATSARLFASALPLLYRAL